ncbi:hypothetical protein GQ600_22396 [Phytophthora cactorum]|nr:hypothetical protein GQ600_22396 [Phytophthora cactorum]
MALTMAKDYQAAEKQRRAKEHNEALSRLEKAAVPRQGGEERLAEAQMLHQVPKICACVETEGGERIPQSTEDSADAQVTKNRGWI